MLILALKIATDRLTGQRSNNMKWFGVLIRISCTRTGLHTVYNTVKIKTS